MQCAESANPPPHTHVVELDGVSIVVVELFGKIRVVADCLGRPVGLNNLRKLAARKQKRLTHWFSSTVWLRLLRAGLKGRRAEREHEGIIFMSIVW
jgi:hypothetical protein